MNRERARLAETRTTIKLFERRWPMLRLGRRRSEIVPFHVVELFKQANKLVAQGRDIISLGIGEPDFTAPPQVIETLDRAARAGLGGYSPPAGIAPLRQAIADYYAGQFG